MNSSWRGLHMHQGDLSLRSGKRPPYELRWKGLSSEPTQTIHLHLSKELISRTAEEMGGCDPAHLALVERIGFQDPLLTQIGLALRRELEQSAPAGKLYAQTAAQMLAVHLLRHYASAAIDIKEFPQGLTRHQVKRVTDFIRTHLNQDLSLQILAEQIGFSVYYFARLFQQTMGVSPHQFVLDRRIERAQHLLVKTDTPLASIALECGFANQSHLTQVFKQHLALTPRSYRQNHSTRHVFNKARKNL
ncbi:MAG TPA: AraC family transcriptional regulator [Ktedonobacteraceae bacterium]|nr:AraC family transcriptional regulator [Ktedonobacteraceae bacterium]